MHSWKWIRWISLWLLLLGSLHAVSEPASLWGIPLSEYALRREALRGQAGEQAVILAGESATPVRLKFRQDSNLMYLTGVEAPGAILVLLPDNSPLGVSEVLFLREQSPVSRTFEGELPAPDERTRRLTGIQEVRSTREVNEFLKQVAQAHPQILLNRLARNAGLDQTLREANPEAQLGSVERLLAVLRTKKSPAEQRLIRAAIRATIEAHRAAARKIAPGVYEYEVEAVIQEAFRRNGSERDAFPCIIGSGPNSCILHYSANRRRMQKGDLVVVDIGAEYSYYAADLTRTYPVSGKFTPRQRALYLAVLDAQKAAERAAKPGVTLRELDRIAREALRNSPLRAKDVDGKEYTLDHFFRHGLGHALGMDVHDPETGQPLPPGAIFTIEPGVYIPTENIGIRIEDDYLMTERGVIKLTSALPAEPEAIERIMKARPARLSSARQALTKLDAGGGVYFSMCKPN
ncbi:MAG: Xaa-Pro aminopeptidase [Fimbriimonadales bacterium]|nr:Xaa-Pro aminopeptidase [Fimbriimonadales bacterium]